MTPIVALIVATMALVSWDAVAYNGKYRNAVQQMAGHIAAAYHVR